MKVLNQNQVQEVNGGNAAGTARAVGKILVRVGHPAAVAVGVVLIVGGIAAGYMEEHNSSSN